MKISICHHLLLQFWAASFVIAATPSPTATTAIAKLRLINADTDQPIPAYDPLPSTSIINLSTLSTTNLNIEAITEDGAAVRSVQWKVNGSVRTENNPRWALCGNSGSNFFACGSDVLKIGSAVTTIAATPFAQTNADGAPGRSLSISLTLTSGGGNPPTKAPASVQPPTKAPVVAVTPTKAPAVVATPTKAPVAATTPPTSIGTMTLTLMNADLDTEIGPLLNETVIDLTVTPKVNIRANVGQGVASVWFSTNGAVTRTDNFAPYSYQGNSGNDYVAWTPAVGRYTVTAAAYSSSNAGGSVVSTVTISFVVVNPKAPTKAPAVVQAPTKAPIVVVAPNKAPVNPKAPTKAPTKAPVVVTTPTKAPVVVQTPTKAPVVIMTPTKAPAVVVTPTKAPVDTNPPTKAPTAGGMPTTPAPTWRLRDMNLTLINADTDVSLGQLRNDTVIDIATTPKISIRADIDEFFVDSVQFVTNGVVTRTDSTPPFSYLGNMGDDFYAWIPTVGRYTVVATGYDGTEAFGPVRGRVAVTFDVINSKPGDGTAPRLLGLSVDPSFVDVTLAPAPCVVSLKVQDDQSGLKQVVVGPVGYETTYIVPNGTNTGNKVVDFNVTVVLPPEAASVELKPLTVSLTDNAMNTISLNRGDLLASGFPSTIEVRQVVKLLNFTVLSPTPVDVSNGPVNVTFQVTSQSLGIQYVWIDLVGFGTVDGETEVDQLVPGVQTTTVSVQIPALIPPTTFTIEVSMLDFLRNGFFLDSDGLEARGFPSTVEVINTVLDETPPELLDFTLSSGVYNLTAEGGSAISSSFFANLTVRDDQSGISTVTLLATGDNGGQFQEFLYSYTQPPLVGTFKFSNDYWFTLSWYEPQDYKLAVILEDAKNNVRSLQSNDLIARGLPGGFKVVV